MGKDTVSNQKKTIATKGTKHVARAKAPTDKCRTPKGDVAPFPNYVPTTRLAKGQTQNTFIAGQPVWTKVGEIGPPSEDPHPPFTIGVVSGVEYRKEASANQVSTDVFLEGNGVVRTNDVTWQNHKNTLGFCDGSQLGEGANDAAELAKLKCCFPTLKVHGIAGLTGKQDERELGWPGRPDGSEAYYLEILTAKEVEFISTRVDLTKPQLVRDPACQLEPKHTKWLASRSGGGAEPETKTGSGKKFKLDKELTKFRAGQGEKGFDTKHSAKPDVLSESKAGAAGKFASSKVSNVASAEGVGGSLQALYELWQFKKSPCTIEVQAISCGGVKTAKIRVFPANKVDFTLTIGTENEDSRPSTGGRDAMRKVRDAFADVAKVAGIAQKIVSCMGGKVTYKLFVGFQLKFEMNYEECKETKETPYKDLKTPAHVGLPWKLSASSDPFFQFSCEYPVSLLALAAPYMATAVGLLRRAKIKADLVFKASLGVGFALNFGRDRYDWPVLPGGEIIIKPEISLYLEIQTGIKIAKFGATFPGKIILGLRLSEKYQYLIKLTYQGEIKTVLFITLFEDSWVETTFKYEPEALSYKTDQEKAMYLIEMPSA